MEDLNLPIIKEVIYLPKSLSMDDYFVFVTLNLQYTVDRKAVREQKRQEAVKVRFSL
jgi:hypothetical protein